MFAPVSGNSIEFVEYTDLKPEINKMNNLEYESSRRLCYFIPNVVTNNREDLLAYDLDKGIDYIIPHTMLTFDPGLIVEAYYDFHNKRNYCFLNPGFDNESSLNNGWYEINIDSQDNVSLTYTNDNVSMLRKMPKKIEMNDGDILYSSTKYTDENQNDRYERLEEFKVINNRNNSEIWSFTNKKARETRDTNVYWIGGDWLFKENSYYSNNILSQRINNQLINYRTGNEYSVEPNIICGFGKNYLMLTTPDSKGIIIQDTEENIIYKDESFDLIGMIRNYNGLKVLNFAYIDLPYIYYTVYVSIGAAIPVCSVIIDLHKNKSYRTNSAWELLGVYIR